MSTNTGAMNEQPMKDYEMPLHSAKITVCCDTSAFGIIRLYFLKKPYIITELKEHIADEIKATDGTLLQRVMDNF
jgi:hypothetical protein